MVFVIPPAKYHTLPEAVRRLWYRDRAYAALVGANLAIGSLIALVLLLGLPIAGVYLTIAGGLGRIVVGVAITLAGPVLAQRFTVFLRPRVLAMAWLLVGAAADQDSASSARLTAYERDATDSLRTSVSHVSAAAAATAKDGDWERMLSLRTSWLHNSVPKATELSRSNVVAGRLEMITKLLIDGSEQANGAVTFARMIVVIAEETDQAFVNLLAGKPIDGAGTTWPAYYDQGRLDDIRNHAREPASLQKLLDAKKV